MVSIHKIEPVGEVSVVVELLCVGGVSSSPIFISDLYLHNSKFFGGYLTPFKYSIHKNTYYTKMG